MDSAGGRLLAVVVGSSRVITSHELAAGSLPRSRQMGLVPSGKPLQPLRPRGRAWHTWAAIAVWAGVSPQALHKKYAEVAKVAKDPSSTCPNQDNGRR